MQLVIISVVRGLEIKDFIYCLKNLRYLFQLHFKVIHSFKATHLFFRKYDLHGYLLMDIVLTKYTRDTTFNKLPCNKYVK